MHACRAEFAVQQHPSRIRVPGTYTEAYRSGHNGPDSKSGSPHGLVGSNPTASAIGNRINPVFMRFFHTNTLTVGMKIPAVLLFSGASVLCFTIAIYRFFCALSGKTPIGRTETTYAACTRFRLRRFAVFLLINVEAACITDGLIHKIQNRHIFLSDMLKMKGVCAKLKAEVLLWSFVYCIIFSRREGRKLYKGRQYASRYAADAVKANRRFGAGAWREAVCAQQS